LGTPYTVAEDEKTMRHARHSHRLEKPDGVDDVVLSELHRPPDRHADRDVGREMHGDFMTFEGSGQLLLVLRSPLTKTGSLQDQVTAAGGEVVVDGDLGRVPATSGSCGCR
jgi:hypothetical protein